MAKAPEQPEVGTSDGPVLELVPQLRALDRESRLRAAEQLAAVGRRAAPALDILRSCMRHDSDDEVRAAALRAAAVADPDRPAVIGELQAALRDRAPVVRRQAAASLGEFGAEAAAVVDELWAATADEDETIVEAAATALVRIADTPALLTVALERLNYEDPRAATGAMIAIRKMLFTDSQRSKAVNALWEIALHNDNQYLYDMAFYALAEVSHDHDAVIERLLKEENVSPAKRGHFLLFTVVADAVSRFWKQARTQMLPLVFGALDDPNPYARSAALGLLGEDAEALDEGSRLLVVDRLQELLRQTGEGLRLLRQLGGDDLSFDVLFSGEDPALIGRALLVDAADMMNQILPGDVKVVAPAVVAALDLPDLWARQAAIEWLLVHASNIPSDMLDEAETALRRHISDPDTEVQGTVQAALTRLEDRRRVVESDPWLKLLDAGALEGQLEAIQQIVSLGNREAIRTLVRHWAGWIARGENLLLIDTTAEELRRTSSAVRPLLDLLGRPVESEMLDDFVLTRLKLDLDVSSAILDGSPSARDARRIAAWVERTATESPELARQVEEWRRQAKTNVQIAGELLKRRRGTVLAECEELVRRQAARQLADMSDERFYSDNIEAWQSIRTELLRHAIPALTRSLFQDDDVTIREDVTRTLANVGGGEAVDALARAVVGEEKTQQRRQELLATYYLDPSKARSEEAAKMLRDAVREAKRTLRILQMLNVAVFVVALAALATGLFVLLRSEEAGARLAGAAAGAGGMLGILIELVRDPIAQIQSAMTRLVQVETAFTSFIWELNLNGTYIQSQYVARGVLTDDDIAGTVTRIEDALSLAMNLMATYTEEQSTVSIPRLASISPSSGRESTSVVLRGAQLAGVVGGRARQPGLVAVDHLPTEVERLVWTDREVRFVLPADISSGDGPRTVWISLFVDGSETNALPFTLLPGNQSGAAPSGNGARGRKASAVPTTA